MGRKKRHRNEIRPPKVPSGYLAPGSAVAPTSSLASMAYPSPSARRRIRQRRAELIEELGALLGTTLYPEPGVKSSFAAGLVDLAGRYGMDEVTRILEFLQERTAEKRDITVGEAFHRRRYRAMFARYGGGQPYLPTAEFDERQMQLMMEWFAARVPGVARGRLTPQRREQLEDGTLAHVAYCQDILPPAVPPRPADYQAPEPGRYERPAADVLGWGLDDHLLGGGQGVNTGAAAVALSDGQDWRSAAPDLARMAVDEGLVCGWPADAAAWAPYHALLLLGHLGASEEAAALRPLLCYPDDWLSDQLAETWGQMGAGTLPALWRLLDDRALSQKQRAPVVHALRRVAEGHPSARDAVVAGLVARLTADEDVEDTLNAYLVWVLDHLRATAATGAIEAAFEADRVDLRVVTPDSVHLLSEGYAADT